MRTKGAKNSKDRFLIRELNLMIKLRTKQIDKTNEKIKNLKEDLSNCIEALNFARRQQEKSK